MSHFDCLMEWNRKLKMMQIVAGNGTTAAVWLLLTETLFQHMLANFRWAYLGKTALLVESYRRLSQVWIPTPGPLWLQTLHFCFARSYVDWSVVKSVPGILKKLLNVWKRSALKLFFSAWKIRENTAERSHLKDRYQWGRKEMHVLVSAKNQWKC